MEEANKIYNCKNYCFISNVQFQVPSFVLGNDLIMKMSMITMKK